MASPHLQRFWRTLTRWEVAVAGLAGWDLKSAVGLVQAKLDSA